VKKADSWSWPDGERHMLDWIADPKNRLVLNGRPAYQGKKQVACLAHLPADQRRVMIDVGAHIGLWSFNFAHWFKRVEAFEPVADHRACFVENLGPIFDEVKSVRLHPFALGDREKLVSIRVNPSSTGDSWVDKHEVSGKASVEQKTLDSFQFAYVDLIKVDCEGYEEFVLRGAEETIKQWKPLICVEQKRDMARKFDLQPLGALAYLKTLGYRSVDEISGDYIMQAT
jgi:FkbM family methyltransferase